MNTFGNLRNYFYIKNNKGTSFSGEGGGVEIT